MQSIVRAVVPAPHLANTLQRARPVRKHRLAYCSHSISIPHRLHTHTGISDATSHIIHTQWSDPRELHGIGQYAADAYWIFCRGAWRDVHPADKDLKKYRQWLQDTGGL